MEGNGMVVPAVWAAQEARMRNIAVSERIWSDDNPYWLQIWHEDGRSVAIDLGESGWMSTFSDWMRGRSRWMLIEKMTGHAVFVVDVFEGEQPYYTARHVGVAGSGGSNEVVAYGIGKKRIDGHTDRLWVLPTGEICAGDDVDSLGHSIIMRMGPKQPAE
jgi:hypothetical protein